MAMMVGIIRRNMSKTIFLDTNIYLHYRSFDEIDWRAICQTGEVTIVIPPVVIRELNKHKEVHPQTRIRSRASAMLKKLARLFEASSSVDLNEKIHIMLEDRDPSIDFAQYQLNTEIQDDHIVAGILMYKQEMPDIDITLVTSDSGLTLLGKARRLGIGTQKLSDTLKLPDEPDPEQEKIKRLETTIREMKNKLPELVLVFEGGKQHAEFTLSEPKQLSEDELDHQIDEVKKTHPFLDTEKKKITHIDDPKSRIALELVGGMNVFGITADDIKDYNHGLEVYYAAYRTYLEKLAQYKDLQARTIKLEIWVSNRGTAPADDVDIYMHFPDGFELKDEDSYPAPPQPPKPPPPQPRNALQKLGYGLDVSRSYMLANEILQGTENLATSNVSSLNIKRTKSYDVDFSIQRLKHRIAVLANPAYIVFSSREEAKSFQIEYHILGSTPAYESSGVLRVVIKKH